MVLALTFASAVAALTLTMTKLDVNTDQLSLISPHHPLIELSKKLEPFNFNGNDTFTIVIESPAPERSVEFLKALVTRIEADSEYFQSVFYRIDPSLFKKWMLLYLDKNEIAGIGESLDDHAPLIRGLAASPDITTFFNLINQEMASQMVGQFFTGFLDEGKTTEAQPSGAPMNMDFLIRTLDGMAGYLKGTPHYRSPWASFFKNSLGDRDLEGYFWEGDRHFLIATAIPKKEENSFTGAQKPLNRLRALIQELQASYPDIQAGVTGQEALNNDEMTTALGDMTNATWISLGSVAALMVLFFLGIRRPFIQMVTLAVGLCWTFGWTTLFIGHLNILSVVFAPLLCGLGVDYGIHWFARFEEEEATYKGFDTGDVVRLVNERSGPGILLAGLSTALSFLPLVLTGFRGLMELGLITGAGIILILVADFTVIPAMSVLMAGWRRKSPHPARPGEHEDMLHFSRRECRLIILLVTILCVVGAWNARRVRFDLNPLKLQAPDAPAVVWEKRLLNGSERTQLSAAVFASSPEDAEAKAGKLAALPTVREVQSIFSYLPENQDEKIPLLRKFSRKIPTLQAYIPENRHKTVRELSDTLLRIRFKMQEDKAGQMGADKALVEQMDRVRTLIGEIVEALRGDPAVVEPRLENYRTRFRHDLSDIWNILQEGTCPSPMSVADMPADLRNRFYRDGTWLLRVYPRDSVWEENTLTKFVREVQGVDPDAVGDPVSLYVFATAFKKACIMASLYALAAISLLLLLTLRKLRLVFLALLPLTVGTLWTVGIMGAAGIDFNLANSMFMPLVVGAGVEYGVIILNRWREGTMMPGHLPFSTGKGVILAALTTTTGFGTLMISHHRGIFSLGFVAWVGSLCVLATAIILLPALLSGMTPPKPHHD